MIEVPWDAVWYWTVAAIAITGVWLGVVLTLATLPGIWIGIGVALLCWALQTEMFNPWVLGACVALGLLGEAIEFFASAVGSKRAGGSRSGALGSVIGGVLGAIVGTPLIPIPIIGTVIGAVAGAGLGAVVAERGIVKREWGESVKSGTGAAAGRLVSIAVKGSVAAVIAVAITIDALWS